MPSPVIHTPRDRLERLLDYGVRALRYWWIAAGLVVVGGALSVAFAFTRHAQYQSQSTLFYQERIQASVLQGRDSGGAQRNIGDRYRELLFARSQLAKIIEDPDLDPYGSLVASDNEEEAIDALRAAVTFEVRGQNAFRISYKDVDPERAQKVTQKLADLLIEKETGLRNDSANATVKFAQEQLDGATQELLTREHARAEFLVAHPEFAEDEVQGQSEGAAIRRQKDDDKTNAAIAATGNPRLNALQRQRTRIKARLDAADGPTPIQVATPHTPSADEIAAQRKIDTAQEEVRGAQRALEALQTKGLTDAHPDVRKAKDTLDAAQGHLKDAKSELAAAQAANPDVITVKPPASENERADLEKDLADVESQIAAERTRGSGTGPKKTAPVETPKNDIADKVVQLETEWSRLRREVTEQTERVTTLNDSVFRAQLDAQTRLADEGSGLQIVDPAFLPKQPIGKGKKILVLAGLFVFITLGVGVALGLAILDDRIYRRGDIEQLEIAPVLAVIPRARGREARAHKPPKSTTTRA